MKILYLTPKGTLSIIVPVEWRGTMEELAQQQVPTGLKYKIVEDSEIPETREFRNAWDIADSELTDGVGS